MEWKGRENWKYWFTTTTPPNFNWHTEWKEITASHREMQRAGGQSRAGEGKALMGYRMNGKDVGMSSASPPPHYFHSWEAFFCHQERSFFTPPLPFQAHLQYVLLSRTRVEGGWGGEGRMSSSVVVVPNYGNKNRSNIPKLKFNFRYNNKLLTGGRIWEALGGV